MSPRRSRVLAVLVFAVALAACAEKKNYSDAPSALPQGAAAQPTPPPVPEEPKPQAQATSPVTEETTLADGLRVTRAKAPAAAPSPAPAKQPSDKRVEASSSGAALSPEIIHRVVRQSYPQLHACYSTGLRADPTLQGRMTVRLVIGKDGTTRSANVTSNDLSDKAVGACVSKAFASLTFPPPDRGEVTVSYPLAFSPTDG